MNSITQFKSEPLRSIGKFGLFGFALFGPVSIALSQICIAIALLGWLGGMIAERRVIWRKTPLDFPILLFVLSQVIAVINAKTVGDGLRGWINKDWFILLYYAVINLIDNEDDFKWLVKLTLFSATLSALYGIFQHFDGWDYIRDKALRKRGPYFRPRGFVGFTLTYGGIQLTMFALLAPFYFYFKNSRFRHYLLAALALIFLSVLISFARSAWMGLIVLLAVAIGFYGRRNTLYAYAGIAIVALLVWFLYPEFLHKTFIYSLIDTSETAPFSNRVRLKLWESSVKLISNYPVFGVGFGNMNGYFDLYRVPFDYRGLKEPHNDLLRTAITSGLFGLGAFLFMWLSALKKKWPVVKSARFNPSLWQAAALGGFFVIIAMLFAGITQEYYHDAENAEVWWFAVAIATLGVIKFNQEDIQNG